MSYTATPILNLQLAVPGSGQAFETAVVNTNFTKIDTEVGNIQTDVANLQSVVGARSVADLDALSAISPVGKEGQMVHVDELNCDFQSRDDVWRQVGFSQFALEADRTTAYAKASAQFLVQGVKSRLLNRVTTDGHVTDWEYFAAYNFATNKGGAIGAGWYPVGDRKPLCALTKNISQNGATTATAITWNSAAGKIDRWGLYDSAVSLSRINVPYQGMWKVTVNVYSNGVAGRIVGIRDNNGTVHARLASNGVSGAATSIELVSLVSVVSGMTYLEVVVTDVSAGLPISQDDTQIILEYMYPN